MFRAQSVISFVLLSLFLMPGCKSTQIIGQSKPACSKVIQPNYNVLVLNYETKDLRRLFSRIKTGSAANSLTSHFSRTEKPVAKELKNSTAPANEWSQARIQIVYPHPDGSEEKGLAKLVVSRHSPSDPADAQQANIGLKDRISRLMLRASRTSPELALQINSKEMKTETVDEEIWQLDLPKEELDILLSELSQRGFFNQQERPRGEATVSIMVDQGELSKRWTSEPRLEDLMKQIYDEGELSAFNTQGAKAVSVSFARINNS